MNRLRLFLLLLLIPSLLCAQGIEEYVAIRQKAIREWDKSNALITKLNKLDPHKKSEYIRILEDTVSHCRHALKYYENGLKDLSKTIKYTRDDYDAFNDREYDQLIDLQTAFKRDKELCQRRLTELEIALKKAVSFEKALTLYQEGIKKIEQAKNYAYPSRTIQNEHTVYHALSEVEKLYNKAAALLLKASDEISFSGKDEDKANIQRLANDAKQAANRCREEAKEWQQSVLLQKNSLKNKAKELRDEIRQHAEKELYRIVFEKQKQLLPVLTVLEETSSSDEKILLQQELTAVKESIDAFIEEADRIRITEPRPSLSSELFKNREQQRRNLFYKNLYQEIVPNSHPFSYEQNFRVYPLDGQKQVNPKEFVLYAQQNYRFLLHKQTEVSELSVHVFDQDACIQKWGQAGHRTFP